jgi:hypothetical protein
MFAFLDDMENAEELRMLPSWKGHTLTGFLIRCRAKPRLGACVQRDFSEQTPQSPVEALYMVTIFVIGALAFPLPC